MEFEKLPFRLIDLTHDFFEGMPAWNEGGCGFRHDLKLDYQDRPYDPVQFRVQQIKMHAGIGTHMDAPCHCVPGGKSAGEFTIEELAFPCVVIHVPADNNELYTVSVDDILCHEAQYGNIQPGDFVMIHTGWASRWPDPSLYRNGHVFPSVGKDAIDFLMKRQISGLGIDTMSPDRPQDGFPVHQALLEAGKIILENVAHLEQMLIVGGYVIIAPLKIIDGSEAPSRVIGVVMRRLSLIDRLTMPGLFPPFLNKNS